MARYNNRYIFAPEKQRKHPHRVRNILLILLPLIIAVLIITNIIVSRNVRLEKLRINILNLPRDLESFSILHLSDLHGAELGDQQKAVKTALGSTRYSCVVMTGDMLGEDHDTSALLDLIRLMPAETPKFYIPGDRDGSFLDDRAHGSLSVYTDWAETLIKAGITLLDRPVSITREKGTIWFVPEEIYTLDLDRMSGIYSDQLQRLQEHATTLTADEAARIRVLEYELQRMEEIRTVAKEQFKPEDMQVVLTHTPLSEEYVREISRGDKEKPFSMLYAGLILAGHYNGGQWRLPLGGAVYVPELGWFPPDEGLVGLNYADRIPQYISPGLGADTRVPWQPGRLYNSPVVTLITLTRKAV